MFQAIARVRDKINRIAAYTGKKVNLDQNLDKVLNSLNTTPSPKTKLSSVEAETEELTPVQFERKYGSYVRRLQDNQDKLLFEGRSTETPKFQSDQKVRLSLPHRRKAIFFGKESIQVRN